VRQRDRRHRAGGNPSAGCRGRGGVTEQVRASAGVVEDVDARPRGLVPVVPPSPPGGAAVGVTGVGCSDPPPLVRDRVGADGDGFRGGRCRRARRPSPPVVATSRAARRPLRDRCTRRRWPTSRNEVADRARERGPGQPRRHRGRRRRRCCPRPRREELSARGRAAPPRSVCRSGVRARRLRSCRCLLESRRTRRARDVAATSPLPHACRESPPPAPAAGRGDAQRDDRALIFGQRATKASPFARHSPTPPARRQPATIRSFLRHEAIVWGRR